MKWAVSKKLLSQISRLRVPRLLTVATRLPNRLSWGRSIVLARLFAIRPNWFGQLLDRTWKHTLLISLCLYGRSSCIVVDSRHCPFNRYRGSLGRVMPWECCRWEVDLGHLTVTLINLCHLIFASPSSFSNTSSLWSSSITYRSSLSDIRWLSSSTIWISCHTPRCLNRCNRFESSALIAAIKRAYSGGISLLIDT